MKKLMAFDVDGTLLFDRKVEPESEAAIHRWQDAGHLAVCNTGKSIYATQVAFENYDINFDYYVLYTGAVVCDANYEILFKKTLDLEVVIEVIDHLSTLEGINVYATTLDHDYQVYSGIGGYSNILPAFSPMDRSEVENHEYVGIPMWIPDPTQRAEILAWILDNYSDRLDCHRNLEFLDIVPKGSDKGLGLKWLVENHLGGEQVETYTLGDSWNDLGMHAIADHAASFTYSPAEVQQATEYVVDKAYEFIDRALTDGE